MGVEKITIGSNIPAYEVGEKSAPAVIVLQVGVFDWPPAARQTISVVRLKARIICRSGGV